jgi:hypothetical protein
VANVKSRGRAVPAPRMSAEEKKWRARDDSDTLRRAQEIMADKGRHSAAKAHAQTEIKRLQNIVGVQSKGKPAGEK